MTKPIVVQLTDPAEIEAVKRNGAFDPIGSRCGRWAYKWSIECWRAERRSEVRSEGL